MVSNSDNNLAVILHHHNIILIIALVDNFLHDYKDIDVLAHSYTVHGVHNYVDLTHFVISYRFHHHSVIIDFIDSLIHQSFVKLN